MFCPKCGGRLVFEWPKFTRGESPVLRFGCPKEKQRGLSHYRLLFLYNLHTGRVYSAKNKKGFLAFILRNTYGKHTKTRDALIFWRKKKFPKWHLKIFRLMYGR